MNLYRVVFYKVGSDVPPTVIARTDTKAGALRMSRLFCGSAWTLNRRPDTHILDSREGMFAVKVEKESA